MAAGRRGNHNGPLNWWTAGHIEPQWRTRARRWGSLRLVSSQLLCFEAMKQARSRLYRGGVDLSYRSLRLELVIGP